MEHSDNDTGDHIQRIGHFAARLATALDMPKEWAELLLLAAPMHDIGKVGTPDDILQKTGDLTPEEWEVMKAHTIAGYDILRDSSSELLRMGAEIALSHHERFDGSGYPFGLADEQIPLSARITALCDVFDTLLSTRPHKQPWPLAKVLDYIYEQEGGHFDPRVVAAFRTSLPDLLAIRSAFGSEHLQNGEQDLAQAEG
jgi:putative two-component system response regulator